MKLFLEWGPKVPLKHVSLPGLIYTLDESKLPEAPGVYVFGRVQRTGEFEALYVGMANDIRGRVTGHQNNLRLMGHIEAAKKGEKVVRAGVFKPKRGQRKRTCLPIIERALIRYFL
ncbi:MAG: hypothetical protein WAN51_01650, partial [Alphaproteobacteria bacterium]